MAKENEVIPSEQEVEEAAKQFKVTKAHREPQYMTPEEVRVGTPPKKQYNQAEEDETYIPPREPHKPQLEDGGRYNAKITNVEVQLQQPVFNDPTRFQDLLVYTFNIGGVEIKRRVTKSTDERSNLAKLAKEFGFGDISVTGFAGRQLVGKKCRVKIKHSKPTVDGSVFDNIDLDSLEAVEDSKPQPIDEDS
jgi:hypothetical protein